MTTEPETGLAVEEHPPERSPSGEPRFGRDEPERTTRKPLAWWDRIKFLLLGVLVFAFLVWNTYVSNQGTSALTGESIGISIRNALSQTIRNNLWLLVLLALEALRQIHYLICEHSAAYYGFFQRRVFGGLERRAGKMNAWNRYRLARATKWLLFLVILSFVLGKIFGVSTFTALFTLPARVITALPLIFQLFIYVGILLLQFVALFYFLSRGGVDVYFPDDVKTRFSDVWGQDPVLNRVKENMVFLENPDAIEAKGGYVPGGILLWGPPGTGKTLMAEAVAGETGRPFVFIDPGAFINMFMGVGILKVKSLFRKLRKIALKYGGVIAFFDEADALGNRGQLMPPGSWGGQMTPAPWNAAEGCNGMAYLDPSTQSLLMRQSMQQSGGGEAGGRNHIIAGMGGMGGGGMGTLQALLSEIQGLSKPRGFFNRKIRRALGMRPKPPPKYRILIMMATNMPQALDEALLRPGRIDRIYKVGYPSKAGRVRTYQGYFDKVPHELTAEQIDKLATITPYATGATIKDIVNESLINAFRDGREVINWENVIKAKQLKDLGPPEDVEYIERERHSVAVHEACHAVVAYRVRHHLTIDIATIEKGGTYLGMVASIPPEDQFTRWRSEYEADVMVSLASLAGERLFFEGDSSSGCSGDLETATRLATFMEGYWGMGTTIASHGVTHEVGIGGGGKPGGEEKKGDLLEGSLGTRIESKLADLFEATRKMLEQNRAEILSVAHALEANKTVTGDDVTAVIERRRGPIIDGTPYASEDFVAALETYHVEAVTAHRDHAKPRISMPTITVPFQPPAPGTNGGPNGSNHDEGEHDPGPGEPAVEGVHGGDSGAPDGLPPVPPRPDAD
jgi:ATP-dependent Zn protease